MFENERFAVLGAGKLGEALIAGMVDANVVARKQFIATAAHKERLEQLQAIRCGDHYSWDHATRNVFDCA